MRMIDAWRSWCGWSWRCGMLWILQVCFPFILCLCLPFRVVCPVLTSFQARPQPVQLGTGGLWQEHKPPYGSVSPTAQPRAQQALLLPVTRSHRLRDSLAHFSPKVKTRAGPGHVWPSLLSTTILVTIYICWWASRRLFCCSNPFEGFHGAAEITRLPGFASRTEEGGDEGNLSWFRLFLQAF